MPLRFVKLHYQNHPKAQGKLVSVIRGGIFDFGAMCINRFDNGVVLSPLGHFGEALNIVAPGD